MQEESKVITYGRIFVTFIFTIVNLRLLRDELINEAYPNAIIQGIVATICAGATAYLLNEQVNKIMEKKNEHSRSLFKDHEA